MCRVLGVSRSGYYRWRCRPQSRRSEYNELLLVKIKSIFKKSRKTYGSPRVYVQLRAEGETCGKRRVERLMSANGILAKQRRKFVVTTDSRHTLPVAENTLNRRFSVDSADRVWLSDITYIPTAEGWLYQAAVMDLYHRAIVGWAMSSSLDKQLIIDALKMAYRRRKPAQGLMIHSDRGSQYASEEYRKLVASYGMHMSMSRKGNCWDNAPMESFFGTLKKECVHLHSYRTRQEARKDIFEYIEVFYNRHRLHSSLGYVSPEEFQRLSTVKRAA